LSASFKLFPFDSSKGMTMPTAGVNMRKIKTILRLHYEAKLSQRQISRSVQLSIGAVNKYIARALEANLSWPLAAEYQDDTQLLKQLQPPAPALVSAPVQAIDFAMIHKELRRQSVTLQLLWEEHKQVTLQSISYNYFCLLYRAWKKTQPKSMRQNHKAGDKVFVDYAGPTMEIIDPDTGAIRKAQIFVGVLGASNYTYAEATWSQKLADWIGSHRRMLEFFGGAPALIVPDNLRSAINKACRYEPEVNPAYADFIEHYGTAVLPARPYKPKDKAKAENGVLIVERWIMARLRNNTFNGLTQLNLAISDLIHELNHRAFKKLPGSRASAFTEIDKPALKPLPAHPYLYLNYKKARVHMDYHVELERHYYSVPYQWISKEIELRFTAEYIECWYQGKQIALHTRSYREGAHTTLAEHMPKSHRKHMEWTPGRFLNWAAQIGSATAQLVKHLLECKPHPEQGYRSCLGLLNLSKRYGNLRLEKACEHAWNHGLKTRRSVDSILSHKLEDQPAPIKEVINTLHIEHENLRGKNYYH
jgi:transposase